MFCLIVKCFISALNLLLSVLPVLLHPIHLSSDRAPCQYYQRGIDSSYGKSQTHVLAYSRLCLHGLLVQLCQAYGQGQKQLKLFLQVVGLRVNIWMQPAQYSHLCSTLMHWLCFIYERHCTSVLAPFKTEAAAALPQKWGGVDKRKYELEILLQKRT